MRVKMLPFQKIRIECDNQQLPKIKKKLAKCQIVAKFEGPCNLFAELFF